MTLIPKFQIQRLFRLSCKRYTMEFAVRFMIFMYISPKRSGNITNIPYERKPLIVIDEKTLPSSPAVSIFS